MKKNSKKSILLLSIGGGLFICLISIYLSRNMLLQSITNKRTTHIEQTYGLQIHYQNLQMKGCNEVTLQGLFHRSRPTGYPSYTTIRQRQAEFLETAERKY